MGHCTICGETLNAGVCPLQAEHDEYDRQSSADLVDAEKIDDILLRATFGTRDMQVLREIANRLRTRGRG